MLLDYPKLVDDVLSKGDVVESRIGPTRELICRTVTFTPYDLVWRPKLNKALGWMELLQLIAGVFDVEEIMRVAPSAKREYFTGVSAYGPRIYSAKQPNTYTLPSDYTIDSGNTPVKQHDDDYIQRILREVRDVPNTRQAVLFIGKSWDVPSELSCTMTYQFLRRGNRLHAVVTMRSWDVIRGLPYDIVMFGGLLQAAAHVLTLEPGLVHVTAGSLHLYESDVELIPTHRRMASYHLHLPKDAIWNGIRTVCKNQVHQRWEDTESKAPHFIHMSQWRDVTTGELEDVNTTGDDQIPEEK